MKRRANSPMLCCLGLALCVVVAVLTANTALLWDKTGAARPSSVFAQAGRSGTDAAQGEQPEQDFYTYLPLLVAQSEPYVFLDAWGNEIGFFSSPEGIAVSGDGSVYVADTGNHRIQIIDARGKPLMAFGVRGNGAEQFDRPSGIAVDGDGNLYVVDSWNDRVQKLDSQGAYLTQWGSKGNGEGQFDLPTGIAMDGEGNVYVADSWNDRVQKFDSQGAYLTQWGSSGSGDGQFALPTGIAVDGEGKVYVADAFNHRVQKFDSEGGYLTQWEFWGQHLTGRFPPPRGIAVDGEGNVYVADTDEHRVQKFTSQGVYLTQWGGEGSGDGQFAYPSGIAVDGQGNVYVVDTYNDRVQQFDPVGSYLAQWREDESADGQFANPIGIAVEGESSVYVTDTGNDRVLKFTSDGAYLTQWGERGSGDGQFADPVGIAVDGVGNVYVVDTDNHRVQKFDSDGSYLAQWGGFGSGAGQFNYPSGTAVDGQGNVYVVDEGNGVWQLRVQKFTSEGMLLLEMEIGICAAVMGMDCTRDIAVDGQGNVYVADVEYDLVRKFDSDGNTLTQWGGYGSGVGQFDRPSGIAVDREGNVYVADAGNLRIQKFTSQGTYLTHWRSEARRLSVDDAGNVYVVGGGRVQKFGPDYPEPDPIHGLALNGSFEETPDLTRWAYGGALPVTLVSTPTHGLRAARLGAPVPQEPQAQGMAWLRQTMYIRPEWERPLLSFRYRLFANDSIGDSDFHVWLTRTDGSGLAEILRDGYDSSTAPPPGYDMGWRTVTYDLSAFKGQNVRLVFENRYLHDTSWGIWTVVDDVRVIDVATPQVYFPLMLKGTVLDIVIVYDRSGSMQEDTRCYGCWEPDPVTEYPAGTTFPLPYTIVPTTGLALHCQPSEPLNWPLDSSDWYISIEAEHYSRYLIEADYHRDRTEYPKTWWTMQRQPNTQASGPDARGAFMKVGPHSDEAIHVTTLNDIVHPPDHWTTPRLDYDFTVPADGTYYVWMRAQGGVDWWDNAIARRSVHVGLNGLPMATGLAPRYGPYGADSGAALPDHWGWSRVLTLPDLNATGPGAPYTLNFWAAGPGFSLDKIVITNNPRTDLDRGGRPLSWDYPGVEDAGPVETHGRTDWACMGELDPRFAPLDPLTGERDDLYDDAQPIRAAKEAAKNFVRRFNPQLDQIGYVWYSTEASIREELYCLQRIGSCEDFENVVAAIESTFARGGTNIADALWDGMRVLTAGPESRDGTYPPKRIGQLHYGRPNAAHVMILMTDGQANQYPDLPSGDCYSDDLWPDQPGETTDQRRARECVVWFAERARDQGIVIYTIGLGSQVDGELLDHVADLTGGWYYFAPSAEELDAIFENLMQRVTRH